MTTSSAAVPTSGPSEPGPVDAGRWPDVAVLPESSRARVAIARRLFLTATNRLPVAVRWPDGRVTGGGAGDPAAPVFVLRRPDAFFARLGSSGTIGFGEGYMAGDWTDDGSPTGLADVMTTFADRVATLVPPAFQHLRRMVLAAMPASQDNDITGARANISHHYDLSNDLFSLFLDPTMTYSSALFDGDPYTTAEPLVTAQQRKVDTLLDSVGVGPGTQVLEIGTGWGELALRAAGRGAEVTTVTISTEQAALAGRRVLEAGVADRVDIRLQDYREVRGRFDAVVSVEMIEAVGANHWPEYFSALGNLTAPGGRVGIQAITMPDDRMRASRDTYTWIRKYIFPGGQLPSVESIRASVAEFTDLHPVRQTMFGAHYAATLARWRSTFEAAAGKVRGLGFDETFSRMWSLYLAYSEAGFRTGYLDVGQFVWARPALTD
ncbi:class I SAM-dependent methyltransferase [Jatrophihabitans sp. YIM 134969]